MKRRLLIPSALHRVVLCAALFFGTLLIAPAAIGGAKIVVANRASATISVIDARTDTVTATIPMPTQPGDDVPEPMYVVHVSAGNQVFVGDRSNNRVVAFNASSFQVINLIPVGNGVFHMWADRRNKQLWVNNDVDNTTSVIHVQSHGVIATVPTPADLVADGGAPHDVFVHPQGTAAYVSVLALASTDDFVVKFDTATFAEVARLEVGLDPHLTFSKQEALLFVPCQNTDEVVVVDESSFTAVTSITVPAAHGAAMSKNGKVLYTTNIAGGGLTGLIAIDTETGAILSTTNTPYPVPHNIALTPNGKIYVTHSGDAANRVTVYRAKGNAPAPALIADITVGTNPFGLAFVP